MFRDRWTWYLGVSSYWFAASMKWLLVMLLLPGLVNTWVPSGEKNGAWGFIVALGAIEAVIGPSLWGALSDRVGRRIPFLLAGTLVTCVAFVIFPLANNVATLAIGYVILQVGDDIATGPYAALLPDLVPSEHRGRASGAMGVCQFSSQIVGGILVAVLGPRVEVLFGILIALHLIFAVVVARTVGKETAHPAKAPETKPSVRTWFRAFAAPKFRIVWAGRFLVSFGVAVVTTYGVNYLGDVVRVFSVGPISVTEPSQAAAVVLLVISGMGIVGALLGGKWSDQVARWKIASLATALMAVTIIPFGMVGMFAAIVGLAVGFGLGYGAYGSADWALAADVLPDESALGKDLGIWQASIAIPQLFLGTVGTMIDSVNRSSTAKVGYAYAFMIAAGGFVIAALLLRRLRRLELGKTG